MANKKSINIYMGIIGEAYVDKENAYAVLLAAKKNILDVEAILASAQMLSRPLQFAINNADEAIDAAVDVYELLKSKINESKTLGETVKFDKYVALLADLNENDFDGDGSDGGNIYTAKENKALAESLDAEINDIINVANELLDANRLNAVVRCKEYNIAKEIFESMIPDRSLSPEDISDAMEAELIRRINAVRDEIDYVNIVSDQIQNVSKDVTDKINAITNGTDEVKPKSNETLYWYAGNLDPRSIEMTTKYNMTYNEDDESYYCQTKNAETGELENVDFGIAGPLRANKWFKQPLHLVQDGQLIAGVDGGKAKYQYWYVAVPHLIMTSLGEAEYNKTDKSISKYEWCIQNQNNEDFVKPLKPCEIDTSVVHGDEPHPHTAWANIWIDKNNNNIRDYEDTNMHGYELDIMYKKDEEGNKIVDGDGNYVTMPFIINGIEYDIWKTDVNIYNKSRLNVFFNLGEVEENESTTKALYYYIGNVKPTIKKEPSVNNGWVQITQTPTKFDSLPKENPVIDSPIYYVAIPEELSVFDIQGNNLTDYQAEETSKYTYVYSLYFSNVKYNVYITGDKDKEFNDRIYVTDPSKTIDIDPTPEVTLSSITWNCSLPTNVNGGTSFNFNKGTIIANYSDGTNVNVTDDAIISISGGAEISEETIIVPNVAATIIITARYSGKSASKSFTVRYVDPDAPVDNDYYLYVGHEDPNTLDLDNITAGSFIDNEMTPGWVNLTQAGISVDDNTQFDIYVEGNESAKWYIASPKPLVSTVSDYSTVAAGLEKMTNNVITVKGHEYNVFTRSGESKHTSMWFTSINNVTDSNHIFK